jgi:tetratricopeptide (TPR) repeat protein
MKNQLITILTIGIVLLRVDALNAQIKTKPTQTPITTPVLALTESDIRKMVREEVENGGAIRDRVQSSVDRSVNTSVIWIQTLLTGLSLGPIFVAVFFWIYRRSILGQVIEAAKKEVTIQIESQLKKEIEESIQVRIKTLEKEIADIHKKADTLYASFKSEIKRRIQKLPELDLEEEFKGDKVPEESLENIKIELENIQALQSTLPDINLSANDYFKLGNLLSIVEEYDQAINAYQSSLKLNPSNKNMILRQIERAEMASKDLTGKKPESLRVKAIALRQYGLLKEAISLYEKLIEIEPENSENYFFAGIAFDKNNQVIEAIKSYQKATSINEKYIKAWNNLGRSLRKNNQFGEAILAFQRAIDIDPYNYEAWMDKASALRRNGQRDQALEAYKRAIEINPKSARARFNLACFYSLDPLNNSHDLTLEKLQESILLDSKYRDKAKTDSDFDPIRGNERFQELLSDTPTSGLGS